MPTRFLKDDNGNDSSMRLVFIIFMVVTVTLLVIIAAMMIRSHLAGAGDTNAFDDLLKWLTTGSLGGFLAKVAQKYLERRQPPTPNSQPQTPNPQPQTPNPEPPTPNPEPQTPNLFRSIPDKQLTRNFRLYEMIESTPTGNQEFIRMNWENIGEFNEGLARQLAEYLQWARNLINQRWKEENDGQEISLVITSAYRCHAWEIRQHRSGTSMHTKSLAADWFPRTKSLELSARILKDLHKEWESTVYGHQGGLAIKFPSYDRQGKMITCGYLHTDLGRPRRWTY